MKYFIFLSILFTSFLKGQTPTVKKAERLYNSYSYSKVIDKLENTKEINTKATRELAESYQMIGQYGKAEEAYAKVVSAPDKTSADIFAYAQILKMNGKYKESINQMEAYSVIKASDTRVLLVQKNWNYTEDLLRDKGQFKIKNLDMNSSEQDFGATYFKDKIVYTSSRHSISAAQRKWNGNNLDFLDLYIGNSDSAGEIKNSELITKVNKKYHEGPASYNKNGTIVFFTVDNYKGTSTSGIRNLELYVSKLYDNKWSKLESFPLNNNEYSVGHPALNASGNILYFASDMPGGIGGVDLYKIVLDTLGVWGKAENLGNSINTEGNETFPFIHESGLFFFSSDGHPTLGGLDVFVSQITNNQFGKVMNLGSPVNGSKDDFSFVLDETKTKGYFASNREGGKGNDDIYSYELLKPFVFGKVLKGVAMDKEGNVLEKTLISLFDENGHILKTAITAEDGTYNFDIEYNKDLKLLGSKEKYFDGVNLIISQGSENVIVSDLVLEKDPGFSLLAMIIDAKTKEPVEGVTMKITDEKGRVVEYITPANGQYKTTLSDSRLGDGIRYQIALSKQGYLSKTVDFNTKLNKPGEVKVHDEIDLSMGKMELGTDIGKLININPIYFDVNKFNIRPDAATELDKIVKAMNEYPTMVIELGSHTDCRAPKVYNLNLSDKRAKASAAYVISKGVAKDRIYGKGYGESKLNNGCACEGALKSNCSDEEHQQNRRTEFVIVKLKE